MYLCRVLLREWVGNTCTQWLILIYLITKRGQRRVFLKACISYFHTFIPTFSLLEWLRPYNHTPWILTCSFYCIPGEGMNAFILFIGRWSPRQLKDWTSYGSVSKVQVASLPGQHLPPGWQRRAFSIASRCTSLPPLLICIKALGGIIPLTGKFPGLVWIQRERWKSKKKCSLLCS